MQLKTFAACAFAMICTCASAQTWVPVWSEDFESLVPNENESSVDVVGLSQVTTSSIVLVRPCSDHGNQFLNFHLVSGDNDRQWIYDFSAVEGADTALAKDESYRLEFDLAFMSGNQTEKFSVISLFSDEVEEDNKVVLFSIEYSGNRASVQSVLAPCLGKDEEDITPMKSSFSIPVIPYFAQSKTQIGVWSETIIPSHFVHFVVTADKEKDVVTLQAFEKLGDYSYYDVSGGYIKGTKDFSVTEQNQQVYRFANADAVDVAEIEISKFRKAAGMDIKIGRYYGSISIDNIVISRKVAGDEAENGIHRVSNNYSQGARFNIGGGHASSADHIYIENGALRLRK